MGIIEIEGMEFFAFHGCFKEEQIIGTKFIVDLQIDVDTSVSEVSDRLADTTDYVGLYQCVKMEMEQKSHLLEHVAGRIISRLYDTYETIEKAKVKISKLNPPLGGQIQKVSVTLER